MTSDSTHSDPANGTDATTTPASTRKSPPGDVADPVLHAIVDANALDALLEAATVVVDECIVQVSTAGLAIVAIDPATVGMVDLELDAAAFEAYDAHEMRFGVDLDRLRDVVRMAKGDAPVELVVDDATRTLHVRLGELSYTLALIDPDAIRSPPDTVAIADGLDARVALEGDVLSRVVDAADMVASTLAVGVDAEAETVSVRADGDADAVDFERAASDCQTFEPAPAHSLYSVDYLAAITRVLPDDPVAVELDDDAPITLTYDVADGHGRVRFLVAPRLSRA